MFRHLDWFSHISRNTLLGKLKWKNITPGKITTAYLVFCCYTQATNNFITRTQTRAHSRTLTESVIILSSCEDRDWQEVTKVAHVHCDGKRRGRCHIQEHLLHLWDGKKKRKTEVINHKSTSTKVKFSANAVGRPHPLLAEKSIQRTPHCKIYQISS